MHQYQLIIKTQDSEKRYQLNSPEEIMLGMSLKLIIKTGITLREEKRHSHFPFLEKFVPYTHEQQYISFVDAYKSIPEFGLSGITLNHICDFLDVKDEVNISFQVNDYDAKLMPANYWDVKCMQNILNKFSKRFSMIHETFNIINTITTVRVDYSQQLSNSGLLEIYKDLEPKFVWNGNQMVQVS